jgi:SAM-dependent methyltransferase
LENQESFKVSDAGSYDAQAESYDRYVRRLAAPLADRICRLAGLAEGYHVLDVGTGSGLAARRAAQLVAPSGSVLGVDLSSGMIQAARKMGPLPESGSLEFRVMDAERLDLPDRRFDAVISLCAVLHFPGIATSLGEMYRVLKPGGRLVVSYGRVQPISFWPLTLHYAIRGFEELRRIVEPRLNAPGDFLKLASRFPGVRSEHMLTTWSTRRPAEKLCSALDSAGFEKVRTSWLGHKVFFDSAREFVEAQVAIATLLRKKLQSLPAERSAQLHDLLLKSAKNVREKGGKLNYPYGAIFFATRRPADSG